MDPIYDKCLWLASYGPYTPNRPLEGADTTDVAIIGGGYTGLSAAYHLCEADPSLKVVVLEGEQVGFGASGRNGGFAMTVFGLSIWWAVTRFGRERAKEAHHYMERAVDLVDSLVREHSIACDARRAGFLRAATTPGYVKRIQNDIATVKSLGITGIEWIDAATLRDRVRSPLYLGAWWEPRCVILNPAKLARGMKQAAQKVGAIVYENTPTLEVRRDPDFVLRTPEGTLKARKLVFAANAWSHLLPGLSRKQVPAFTYMVATEQLSKAQWSEIGWQGGEGIEDARNLVHYYRPTVDGRIAIGGGPVGVSYGKSMAKDENEAAWSHLEQHLGTIFPCLKGIKVEYRWGGPFSVTMDLAPALGYVGDKRAVYSLGCVGHGVSTTHLNGQVIRDLILEKETDLTRLFFVNRRVIPWPPEPLRLSASVAIRGYLQLEDWFYERHTQL